MLPLELLDAPQQADVREGDACTVVAGPFAGCRVKVLSATGASLKVGHLALPAPNAVPYVRLQGCGGSVNHPASMSSSTCRDRLPLRGIAQRSIDGHLLVRGGLLQVEFVALVDAALPSGAAPGTTR